MNNVKITLLGLIAGLAMTACAGDGYTEYETVLVDQHPYESTLVTHELVAKYKSEYIFDISTQNANKDGYFYSYFFVSYSAIMEEPAFPKTAYYISGYYEGGNVELRLVDIIGKYESYNKVFLSKDRKTLKVTNAEFNPISAPKDKEIQGKTAGRLSLDDNDKIYFIFENYISGTFLTSVKSTYINVEGKDLQYVVREK